MKRFLCAILFLGSCAWAQQINPNTQLNWSVADGCAILGQVYSPQSGTCINFDPKTGWAGTLTSNQGSSDTTAAVTLSAGKIPTDGYFRLDNEWEHFNTATLISGSSYTLGGVTRGQFTTSAASHTSAANITAAILPFANSTQTMNAFFGGGPGGNFLAVNCPTATNQNDTVVFQVGCANAGGAFFIGPAGNFFADATTLDYIYGGSSGLSIDTNTLVGAYADPLNNNYALKATARVVQTVQPSQMDKAIGFGSGISGVNSVVAPTAAAPILQSDFVPSGSTTNTYLCQGTDYLGNNIPGTAASLTNLAASGWGSGALNIYCPLIPGAVTTTIYRTAGGPNQGIIHTASSGQSTFQDQYTSATAGSPNASNTTLGAVCANGSGYCVLSGTSGTPPVGCSSGLEGWEYHNTSAAASPAVQRCLSGTWTAVSASGIQSINGDTTPTQVFAASGGALSVATAGGTTTYTLSGSAGTGTINSGGPLSDTVYPAGSAGTVVGPAPNNYTMPPSSTTTQINAVTGLSTNPNVTTTTVGIRIPPNAISQPFANAGNNYVDDQRLGTSVKSLRQFGARCDMHTFAGGISGNVLSTTSSNAFLSTEQGKTVVGICNPVGGVQTAYEGTLGTQVDATHWNISTNPGSVCTVTPGGATANMEIGWDDTAAIAAAIAFQGAGSPSKTVLSVPAGNCLSHKQKAPIQTLIGLSPSQSQITSFPGEDLFDMGGNESNLGFFSLRPDNRIDLTKGFQYVDASGNLNTVPAVYRPLGQQSAYANNPLGPAWIQGPGANQTGAINGVALTAQNTAVICVPTGETLPTVGEQIVFPYFTTIFSSTVSSFAGSCASGNPVTMAAALPSGGAYDTAQSEWFAGTSFQNIQTAIPATGRSFPITLTVANTLAPSPSMSSNVGGVGVIKIGAEHFFYDSITRSAAGTNSLKVENSIENGTGTTGDAHSIGDIAVPVNPFTYDAMPWPVIPTLNTSTVTSCSITSNVATCLGTNNFYAGLIVTIQGFSGSGTDFLNTSTSGLKYTIIGTGLSGTQFEFNFTHANATGTSGGTALTQTPQNAEHFPAFNVGNYAIGNDQADGATASSTFPPDCFDCTFHDMEIQQWPVANNGLLNHEADFYWVDMPYNSHFNNIDMDGMYCFVEGTPGINIYAFNTDDGDGSSWTNNSCRAEPGGMETNIILGNQLTFTTWDLYGGGGTVPSGAGFNITGYTKEIVAGYGGVSASSITMVHNEPGGVAYGNAANMELNCASCEIHQMHYSGGGDIIIDGAHQKIYQGDFNNLPAWPAIIYGRNTSFYESNFHVDPYSTTYNSTSLLNYGPETHGCIENTTTNSCVPPAWGMIDQSQGQTASTFATGNLAAPYVNAIGSLYTADHFGSMSTAWNADPTLLPAGGLTNGYAGCDLQVTGGPQCYPLNNEPIGPGARIAATLYSVSSLVKQQSGSAQTFKFQMTIQSAGSCTGTSPAANVTPVSTTWTPVSLGTIDLTAYSGCTFQLRMVPGNSTSNAEIDAAYVDLQPVAANYVAQQFTTTGSGTAATIFSGAGAPTGCGTTYSNGSLYLNTSGTTGSILYSCIGSTWTDVK